MSSTDMRPAEIGVVAFAAYRLARLVADDTLTLPLRKRVSAWAFKPIRFGDIEERELTAEELLTVDPRSVHRVARSPFKGFAGDLATCQLCVGVYVSGVLFVMWSRSKPGSLRRRAIEACAAMGAQAFISKREG